MKFDKDVAAHATALNVGKAKDMAAEASARKDGKTADGEKKLHAAIKS
jgi:hypothetical protein